VRGGVRVGSEEVCWATVLVRGFAVSRMTAPTSSSKGGSDVNAIVDSDVNVCIVLNQLINQR
jgi:acetolactate synthase regulatory subunit